MAGGNPPIRNCRQQIMAAFAILLILMADPILTVKRQAPGEPYRCRICTETTTPTTTTTRPTTTTTTPTTTTTRPTTTTTRPTTTTTRPTTTTTTPTTTTTRRTTTTTRRTTTTTRPTTTTTRPTTTTTTLKPQTRERCATRHYEFLGDQCYRLNIARQTNSEAEAYCRERNGYLWVPANSGEQKLVLDFFESVRRRDYAASTIDRWLLGARRKAPGSRDWVNYLNGGDITWFNFGQNRPPNYSQTAPEQCLAIIPNDGNRWNDVNCNTVARRGTPHYNGYICKMRPS